ncbi:MAG TPA: hypothetical protein VFW65_14400 [Pseudonocardiaceae bacterium]|nr:hypothetical protein [Pseudonocardiaceae bacterium]
MRITIEIDGAQVGTFTDQPSAQTAAGQPAATPIAAGTPDLPGSPAAAPVRPPAELLAAAAAQGAFDGGPAPTVADPNHVHTASTGEQATPAATQTPTDHPAGTAPTGLEPTAEPT